MKKGNYIGWLAAAGGLFLIGRHFFRKSEAVKSLNVNVTKIDFNKSDRTFVVFVRLVNPSNGTITIKSIVGDVIWKGTYGAILDYRTITELKPLEERVIQIPVKLNLELVTLLTDLLSNKFKNLLNGKFEIKGNVNAEGFVVPFEYAKTINLSSK